MLSRAFYWTAVAYAAAAAIIVAAEFIQFSLPRFIEAFQNGTSGMIRVTPTIALPVGIALALVLRSGAALWLFATYVLAYQLPYLLGVDPFGGPGTGLHALSRHPLWILICFVILLWLIRRNELRRP